MGQLEPVPRVIEAINIMPNKEEEAAMEAYRQAGVDLPELKEEKPKEPEQPPEPPKPEPKPEEQPEKPEAPQPPAPLQDPKPEERVPRKDPTIYEEYKARKAELREEREAREKAERERDELKQKLEAMSTAKTPEQKKDAQDEIDAFISSHKEWDKQAIADLVALARRGVAPEIDPDLKQGLDDFKAWKAQNAQAIEQQMFEKEFSETLPKLKTMFPGATDAEMASIKAEIDKLSHRPGFHDKDLEYVAWKHQDTLKALVSPKKRGMESSARKDAPAEESTEFDPNADYASMTPAQRKAWEEEYQKAAKSPQGLVDDGQGRMVML